MKYYMAQVEDGKPIYSCQVEYDGDLTEPTEPYTHLIDKEIYDNIDRAELTESGWVIYEPMSMSGPTEEVKVGEDITVVVSMPEMHNAVEVRLAIVSGEEVHNMGNIPVEDGKVSVTLAFDAPGEYAIVASSKFHGAQEVGVIVQ